MQVPALNDFARTFNDPIWVAIADSILHRHGVEFSSLRRAERGENIVFFIDDRLILKIYTPLKNGYARELAALQFASGRTSLPMPQIVEEGSLEGFNYLVTTQIAGQSIVHSDWLRLEKRSQLALLRQLATGLRELHTAQSDGFDFGWRQFLQVQTASAVDKQIREGGNTEWVASMPRYLERYLPLIPATAARAFMHGDVHFGNLHVSLDPEGPTINGLFDLADSLKGFHEYEFVAIGVLMIQGQGDLQREFFRAYGYEDREIDENLRNRLFTLTMLYEHSSLRRYAERLGVDPLDYTLEQLGRAIWNF
jgi:hygromycin-B 7''-O-kinase